MMSRAALAAALWGELQRPFAEVGITNADTSGNLKEPIDKTLRAFDTAWGDEATGTIADGSEAAALSVAVYYGWVAIVAAFQDKDIQVDAPNVRISKSKQGDRYERRLAEAEAAALNWLPDDGASSFVAGTINFGFIEPESEVCA